MPAHDMANRTANIAVPSDQPVDGKQGEPYPTTEAFFLASLAMIVGPRYFVNPPLVWAPPSSRWRYLYRGVGSRRVGR